MKRPLVIPIIFFLAGIFVSDLAGISITAKHVPVAVSLLVLSVSFLIAAIKKEKLFYSLLCLIFFLLGIFRYAGSMAPAENDISKFIIGPSEKVLVRGSVTGDSEWKGASYARRLVFPFRAERLLTKDAEEEVTGTILVNRYKPREKPIVGDKLVIGGKLSLPPGKKNPAGFDYGAHLRRVGVLASMFSSKNDHYLKTGAEQGPVVSARRLLSAARDSADGVIRKYLRNPARAVIESSVLGMRGGISDETSDLFARTGTMHILAVSGLHVGIVAMVIMALLRLARCPKRAVYYLTILGICAFAVFAGGRPSSIRAALMGSFVLFGMSLDRKTDIVNALALSALVITFFQPGQLFRPGFVLSYLAVLSIIYVTPLTDGLFAVPQRVFGEGRLAAVRRYLLKSLSVSFGIWIGMMPVIASYFHIITPSVVLANLLAVPALFVMVAMGFGLLLTGPAPFLAPIATSTAGALSFIVPAFMKAMQAVSRFPFSFMRVSSPDPAMVVAFYAVLAGIIVLSRRGKRHNKAPRFRGGRLLIAMFLLFGANLFVWNEAAHGPPDSLRITFFDAGKADASLLEFPDGSVMMIDGGSGGKGGGRDAGRDILAPCLWQRGISRIDCVLLTHAHEDHIGGLLYVLRNFDVGTVIDGGDVARDGLEKEALYREFRAIVEDKNIRHLTVKRGDIIKGFPDADLAVLNPPADRSYGDANNDSVVVKAVTQNGNSILFCADAESEAMEGMLRFGSLLASDLMKAPHHGAGLGEMSIVKEFLHMSNCACAVVTNRAARLLNKELMKTFHAHGTHIFVTGDTGAVIAEEAERGFIVRGYLE